MSSFDSHKQSIGWKHVHLLYALHLGVIVLSGVFLVWFASYETLWFDEAYSVAMAEHSFADILAIGSSDVHPVLYYWMLHCVYLVFGDSIFAFRLVSVVGMVVLSLLGFTHLRKDFGEPVGLLYSVLVFLIPWSIHTGLQIRMYEWTAVAVMLCAIYGWRIVRRLSAATCKVVESPNASIGYWFVLCISSITAAYLHYYGAIAAFVVQLLVLMSIVVSADKRKRNLLIWAGFAIVAVASYSPWMHIVLSQTSMVAGEFWITFSYPATVADLALFPFNPLELTAYIDPEFTEKESELPRAALFLMVLVAEMMCIYSLGKAESVKQKACRAISWKPVAFFLAVYLGVILIAGALSVFIDQPVLYYRYLTVVLGPVMFVIALVLVKVRAWWLRIFCGILLLVLALSTYESVFDLAHDTRNEKSIATYREAYEEAEKNSPQGVPLVFSDSETTASIAALGNKGLPIVYLDTLEKYEAFEPYFVVDPQWTELLRGYQGEAVFIGAYEAADEFAERFGGKVLSSESYYHPYSANWVNYSKIRF